MRTRHGTVVSRDQVGQGETTLVGDIRVTSHLRTAFDLARRFHLVEGVVAVDALARNAFDPDLLLHFAARYPMARGLDRISAVLADADPKAGSPAETRLRMLLVQAGLPRPVAQHPVQDVVRRRAVWLDLAYPEHKIGIEYEGEHHNDRVRFRRDVSRYTRLVDAGWRIYRYTAEELYTEPVRIIAEITRALELQPR